jgi:hypothetical protein
MRLFAEPKPQHHFNESRVVVIFRLATLTALYSQAANKQIGRVWHVGCSVWGDDGTGCDAALHF